MPDPMTEVGAGKGSIRGDMVEPDRQGYVGFCGYLHGTAPIICHASGAHMQITRDLDTTKGPADWFTGDVYLDPVAAPAGSSTFAAANVHFTPGARTAWHTHPHGQTIYVTEGLGLCQREGGPVEAIRPGDRVFFEPEENHWHGAAADRFMVHIAIQQVDESGSPVTWVAHVTDDEYAAGRDADS